MKIYKERNLTEEGIQLFKNYKNHNSIDKEMVKMMLTYTAEGKFKFSWLFEGEDNLPKYLSSS